MQVDHIRLLYDYHDWANDRLVRHVEAVAGASVFPAHCH